MNTASSLGFSQRDIVYLFLSTVSVFLLGFGAWLVVPMSLLKLGIIGVVGAAAGLLIFSFPKYGLFFSVYYVYAGLSCYTDLPLAALIVFLVAAAAFLRLIRGDPFQLKDPMFNWAAALFAVFVFQSFLFAWDIGPAFSGLKFFLKSLLLVFLVVQLVRTKKDFEILAIVIFVGTLSTVILGWLNLKLGFVQDWTMLVSALDVYRFGSTHINAELRDAWVQNWRSVLAGKMSADEYTGMMQLLLEEAAHTASEKNRHFKAAGSGPASGSSRLGLVKKEGKRI